VLFLIVTGNFPGMIFFEIIPVLIVQMLFTLGLGLSSGC
jgi:lipopolysaccharide transport system permease protein